MSQKLKAKPLLYIANDQFSYLEQVGQNIYHLYVPKSQAFLIFSLYDRRQGTLCRSVVTYGSHPYLSLRRV